MEIHHLKRKDQSLESGPRRLERGPMTVFKCFAMF
jgi:hypothetical protein